jgi:isoaspartyl peptidase/L-asparaginase-like protein (Ntn-hydrolase superfamily)
MSNRRKFLRQSALGGTAFLLNPIKGWSNNSNIKAVNTSPVIVSTWLHGLGANTAAWKKLESGGSILDAVEAGVRVPEADPKNTSVGLGGYPDRDGFVTLDACIMDASGQCGAVSFLQDIVHPISVARKVMEETPHVMLSGDGALEFAVSQGFEKQNLLTENARNAWKEWLKKSEYQPEINVENHDTIGLLAIDKDGNLAGACTTSGMAYKLHGRVGDSPIIGAGLFVDNEVGAACATGVGEAVIRIAGSAIVVELMRQGHAPTDACKMAVERIISNEKSMKNMQVGFLALSKAGEHGGYSTYGGFNYALKTNNEDLMVDVDHVLEW